MSTRSTTHFKYGDRTAAIVYRHTDGYPSGAGADIYSFFEQVEKECGHDTRFGDASYLAAKYVVWLAGELGDGGLNFLSVGVCQNDPGDIEYRYEIDCSDAGTYAAPKRPSVKCFDLDDEKYVEIPGAK